MSKNHQVGAAAFAAQAKAAAEEQAKIDAATAERLAAEDKARMAEENANAQKEAEDKEKAAAEADKVAEDNAQAAALTAVAQESKPSGKKALPKYFAVYGGPMIDPDSHVRFEGKPVPAPMTGWLESQIAHGKIELYKEV